MQPVILDESGKEIKGEGEGYLVFSRPWPGLMRTLYGNHDRYEVTYFSKFPGYYCTGDGKLLNLSLKTSNNKLCKNRSQT